MADPVGVSVAFTDGPLVVDPDWTQLDLTDNLVAGYSIRRGRTSEFDRTGTGTAVVGLNDTGGLASADFDGKQIALTLHDPVADEWSSIFRGHVDEYNVTVEPSQNVSRVAISCVDGLDYLAGFELRLGVDGSAPPGAPVALANTLFYEETSGTVDDRITEVLDDVSWPADVPEARRVFTGNVKLQKTVYSVGTSALTVIDEAAEAEFPAVANRFIDKSGAFVFHGRLARFEPGDYTTKGILTWKVGDGAAIVGDSTYAQMRGLSYSRSRQKVINSALITPQGVAIADVAAMRHEDTGSQDAYGLHGFTADNLRILTSVLTGNDANDECELYADYLITVYNEPQTRVDQITFRSIHPDDPRAAKVWALLCGIDISHRIQLKCSTPEREFDDEYFFVEGITYQVDPLAPEYEDVTLTLDLSPAAYYDYPWTP